MHVVENVATWQEASINKKSQELQKKITIVIEYLTKS